MKTTQIEGEEMVVNCNSYELAVIVLWITIFIVPNVQETVNLNLQKVKRLSNCLNIDKN